MEMNEAPVLGPEDSKRSMHSITAEGMTSSMMSGIGDAYISAAAVTLGASNFYIGMLTAVPQLLGAITQSMSLSALRILKDRKVMLMAGTLLHSLCWLPIIATLIWPSAFSIPVLIAFFSLGTAASLFINPAWSSLVSDIVEPNKRAEFFAHRNQLMQVVLFIATFGTGFVLSALEAQYEARLAFAFVFFFAFLSRLSSVYYDFKTSNVKYEVAFLNEIKFKHLFLLPAYKNELWFLAYVALMNLAVQFCSPFFIPYMLNNLKYDIGTVGLLTAIAILAKVVCFPYWGKAIDQFGNRAVLITTSFMVPLVPIFWMMGNNVWTMAFAQAFSGFMWAGCDFATFNSALSLVGRELRPSFIAKYNAFGAFANAAGAIAGALFLAGFGDVAILGFSGILLTFLISGIGRFVVALIFMPKILSKQEMFNRSQDRAMIFRIVAVHPTQGAIHQVMNGWDFTRKIIASGAEKGEIALASGIEATEEIVKTGGRKLASTLSRRKRL